jgi:hypothetical protein
MPAPLYYIECIDVFFYIQIIIFARVDSVATPEWQTLVSKSLQPELDAYETGISGDEPQRFRWRLNF